jgi:CDP-4-dehydro-6-deoxyglucose reductase
MARFGRERRSGRKGQDEGPAVPPSNAPPEERVAAAVPDDSDQPARSRPSRHYDRRAELIERTELTATGTVRLTFEVVDGRPFVFFPGYFVSVESEIPGVGYKHSPYCILSRPSQAPIFQLIVRMVDGGQRSAYLGSLAVGDLLAFRGPGGHSMMPKTPDLDLVLMATGVGIGPLHSLAAQLLESSQRRSIRLFWGLRLAEDICLLDELEALAAEYPNFSYRISLSQPPPEWNGLRGRLTASVPPQLGQLGGAEYRLVGNGAMTEEMATGLGDMGVVEERIYTEAYFNGKHKPDKATLATIRSRFVATDLLAPSALDAADLFKLERPLGGNRPSSRPKEP